MDFSKIKLAVVDIDGTMTDGMYYVLAGTQIVFDNVLQNTVNGGLMKAFNTKDFWGLEQLQKNGIRVVLLTGSTDNVIDRKIMGLPNYCKSNLIIAKDIENKKTWTEEYISKHNLTWENVAFMGDGGNDLECMQLAGVTACPSDSLSIIKEEAHFVSDLPGGKGAVCDFVLYLLRKIKENGN